MPEMTLPINIEAKEFPTVISNHDPDMSVEATRHIFLAPHQLIRYPAIREPMIMPRNKTLAENS